MADPTIAEQGADRGGLALAAVRLGAALIGDPDRPRRALHADVVDALLRATRDANPGVGMRQVLRGLNCRLDFHAVSYPGLDLRVEDDGAFTIEVGRVVRFPDLTHTVVVLDTGDRHADRNMAAVALLASSVITTGICGYRERRRWHGQPGEVVTVLQLQVPAEEAALYRAPEPGYEITARYDGERARGGRRG